MNDSKEKEKISDKKGQRRIVHGTNEKMMVTTKAMMCRY